MTGLLNTCGENKVCIQVLTSITTKIMWIELQYVGIDPHQKKQTEDTTNLLNEQR